MATYGTPTTKYALPKIDGSSNVSDVDAGIGALADAIDTNMAGSAEGTLAARAAITATKGLLYATTDTNQLFLGRGGSTWWEIGVSPWQPGDLKASWVTSPPAGWLVCDGSAVSRATYAALFAAISTSAGAGDGSTTFNVPDARARALIMPDGSAARMASGDTRNSAGGTELTTLTTNEMPAHVHGPGAGTLFVNAVAGGTQHDDGPGPLVNPSPSSATTASEGGGAAFSNMPPYLVVGVVLIRT